MADGAAGGVSRWWCVVLGVLEVVLGPVVGGDGPGVGAVIEVVAVGAQGVGVGVALGVVLDAALGGATVEIRDLRV